MEMKVKSKEFIVSSELEWEQVGEGMYRKMLGYDETLMMVHVKFDKGGIGQVHNHYHSQTTYVVSGAFEVQIDGKKQVLRKGDGFYIPPHVDHGAVCLEAGELIDVFSPHREDFID